MKEEERAPEEALVNPGEVFRFYFKQLEKPSAFCDLIIIFKKSLRESLLLRWYGE